MTTISIEITPPIKDHLSSSMQPCRSITLSEWASGSGMLRFLLVLLMKYDFMLRIARSVQLWVDDKNKVYCWNWKRHNTRSNLDSASTRRCHKLGLQAICIAYSGSRSRLAPIPWLEALIRSGAVPFRQSIAKSKIRKFNGWKRLMESVDRLFWVELCSTYYDARISPPSNSHWHHFESAIVLLGRKTSAEVRIVVIVDQVSTALLLRKVVWRRIRHKAGKKESWKCLT